MSRKDVDSYYAKICDQYYELKQNLRDFEEEARNGMFPPERIEEIKKQIMPLKDNYERWSYMMFLLNQPTKKEKQTRYKNQHKRFLDTLDKKNSIEKTFEENALILQKTKSKK